MKKKLLFVFMSTNVLFGLPNQMGMAQMEEKLLAQQKVNIIRQISEEQARDVKDNVEHKNPNEKRIQLLNELVADFTKAQAQLPVSTVFRDYSQQNQLLLDLFDLVKQAVDILSTKNINQRTQQNKSGEIIDVALGELNGHSALIEDTLKSIFNAITLIRDHIEATIPQSKELLDKSNAHARRLEQRQSFQKLSKKMIEDCVKNMKSVQKKMKSKFGFLGSLLVGKPFLYKHAYEALKKVVGIVDGMIKTFEDLALKKELYELMKK